MAQEDMSDRDKLFFRRYLTTTIVLKNAQRAGAIINLTMEEWERASQIESKVEPYLVVRVADHKTASSHGSARLVIQADLVPYIERYIVSTNT